jgi:methylated-DNA-[protein]-cysteine S-methyltransferase
MILEHLAFAGTFDTQAAHEARRLALPRVALAVETPYGLMALVQRGEHLAGLRMSGEILAGEALRETPLLCRAAQEITEYFAGRRTVFDLPLAPLGTPFQAAVWRALVMTVPFGRTVAYGELAKRADCPAGARAVGMAMNRNPLPIVIPCHRVIASGGRLGGFGGGEALKASLLRLEGAAFHL